MLVLTRKPGQSLYIGDDVKITLQAVRGNQVRIGIDAPSSVRIYREEIYLQILEENRSAAAASAAPADLGEFAAAWQTTKGAALTELAKAKHAKREDDEE